MVWNFALLAGGGEADRPLQHDSTDTTIVPGTPRNRVEVRYGEPGATFEFRHSWFDLLSSDLFVSTNGMRGAGIGISVDPFPILSAQALLGYPQYTDRVVDAPIYDPDYSYGFRGAFLLPLDLARLRIYVSLSAGKIWAVDKNYNPNSGFHLARTTDELGPAAVRKEVRTLEFFELGLGLRF